MIIFEDYELELEGGLFNLYRLRPAGAATPTADDLDAMLAGDPDDLLSEATETETPTRRRGASMGYGLKPLRAVEKITADILERKLSDRRAELIALGEVFNLWRAELERVAKALEL